MQFADFADKLACGAQFCTRKVLQPLFYLYLKVTHSFVLVVQNEQSDPEITFEKVLKKVCLLF